MTGLILENVEKRYGTACAVKDVNLHLPEGKLVCFLGPSGCGKTTLLRMIAGLETLSGGEIRLDDEDIGNTPAHLRNFGMVFQSLALFPHMTVGENIAYPLKLRGVSKVDQQARVVELLELIQLQEMIDRPVAKLSGGQRQRVAIGRAIVRNPKIFLFDEPLSNLDAALRVQMRLELARLHKELQATMIYVTHDQVEAMTLADKVVVLNGGRIEQVGSPLELYHQPANLFVAGFLGTPKMGFLKGKVTRVERQNCEVLLDAGTRITLPLSGANLSIGGAVTLGIRPEHLNLALPGDCTLQVTADVSERLGSDTFCHVLTASGEALTMRIRGDLASRYGEQLSLHLDAEHCHLFDANGVAVARPLRAAA